MTTHKQFWDFFDHEASPKLARRAESFRKIFKYLDDLNSPLTIVETGCTRIPNNWEGDGQSTILFDRYILSKDNNSRCYSVDINPDSVRVCKELVSDRTTVTADDSVHYLKKLCDSFISEGKTIDLLYLDSYDLDWVYWQPSAIHHLKEFCAISKVLRKDTLVVVDDCCQTGNFIVKNNQIKIVDKLSPGGKGRLVAEYALATGANILFSDYQLGITGF